VINKRTTNIDDVVSKTENTCQNIIMQAMESFSGILIATTNLTENMDTAFERRFLYKVKFDKPSHLIRQKMWQSMIPELTADDAQELSKRYDFSGGQIENIARKCVVDSILFDYQPSLSSLSKMCQEERVVNSNCHPIGFR
jgi:SpoVK/Ycf46/Vps4 family AAA+-type ATPase